jgi:hypothetical protein
LPLPGGRLAAELMLGEDAFFEDGRTELGFVDVVEGFL